MVGGARAFPCFSGKALQGRWLWICRAELGRGELGETVAQVTPSGSRPFAGGLGLVLPSARTLINAAGEEPASEFPPWVGFVSGKQARRWSAGSGR